MVLTDLAGAALEAQAALGGTCIAADLRQVADCEAVVAAALAAHGRIDGLVNAAGVWVEGPLDQATEEDWARCIDVNLKGSFFMCARAIPALTTTQGAIVTIASDAGVTGNAGAAIYCASKGGVVVMTKALARDKPAAIKAGERVESPNTTF